MATKETWAYRYVRDDGTPLLQCPLCAADFRVPKSLTVGLIVGNAPLTEGLAYLTASGDLVDTAETTDGAIAAGYHASTFCTSCGESLVDYEERVE